ncbi:MAG TPA: maleylpyruvate isomerase family mycothiol-dependent enzyme [Blastocatellia bacterium]|nr:maleylpyruvate isomerase family mycothiol-dependent enzyme [Blastocatellia bacterium]
MPQNDSINTPPYNEAGKKPQAIQVTHLFAETLDALLDLLTGLSPEEWQRPTVCAGWTVKDVAAHLLGGEVSILSRKRDGFAFSGSPFIAWDDLVALINDLNDAWVKATRRLSPQLLCDLLRFAGEQTNRYFASLDPDAIGGPVDWAGPEPAPVWLDLAREYTERWHHQQQIRDATGRPGLSAPRYLAPVLDAFVRALPRAYRHTEAADGTRVTLEITGAAGNRWHLLRESGAWQLYLDAGATSAASVSLDEDLAWRLFTKGIKPEAARARARISGDERLALPALGMISIMG